MQTLSRLRPMHQLKIRRQKQPRRRQRLQRQIPHRTRLMS